MNNGPKQRADPVYAQKRDKHRSAYGTHTYKHQQYHKREQSGHDTMHILPLREKCGVDSGDTAELNHTVYNDIDITEENSHVTDGSQPKLDGRVACKSRLHPEPSGYKADCDKQRHRGGMRAYHICRDQHNSRYNQLRSCREPELYPEHHGKVDGHTHKRCITRHENIFLHQSRRADHIGSGSQIDTPRELHYQHEEDKQPGLETPRYEIRYVRDIKGSLRCMPVTHINTSPHIRRSYLREDAAWPPCCCLR